MSFTLYGYENNPRTRIIRIVAAAEGIPLQHYEVIPRRNIGKEEYMKRFPLSRGKIPGLEGPAGFKLTETLAIATYLANLHNRSKLMGDHDTDHSSGDQAAQVLSWMSWANQELLPTLAEWFLPLIPHFTDPAPYTSAAVAKGKQASLAMLASLEAYLRDRTYLVGDAVTLADIMVAVFVSRGLEWVLAPEWRAAHPATMRHFEMVERLPYVRGVVPDFVRVAREPENRDPRQDGLQ